MAPSNHCWICIRPVNKKLDCVCGRSWHLKCVNTTSHNVRLINGENGLKVFETVCPECFATEADKKKWYSGEHFQPISKEVFNDLLEFILLQIKKEAPSAFFWSADNFSECGRKTIDIKEIEKRIKEKYYESPKCFLNDIQLIHHNLLVMVENPHRFPPCSISTRIQLDQFKIKRVIFKRSIDHKMRLLIDCPYCVHNMRTDYYNWVTMDCPWGHPLILAGIKGKKQLAKMLKFNRESKRVDVIVLASEESDRVDSDECRIPCYSDLYIRSIDGTEARRAKNLANTYINRMKRKFKKMVEFSKERKPLTSLQTDFIEKPLPAVLIADENEVIDLIDDDESIASNDVCNADFIENGTKLQKDNDDTSKKENNSPCEENSNSSSNGDVVIDEVAGGDSPGEQDTDSNASNKASLTTMIEKVSDSAINSQPAIVPNSRSALTTTTTSTVPQPQMNLPSTLDNITSIKITKTPIQSPSHTPFTLNASDCQFIVEPDDEVEDQPANITAQFIDSQKTTNSQETMPAPNFVVEDNSEVWPTNQDVPTIPPARFLLTPDDKGATSTIDSFPNVSISPHSSIESVSTMLSSEAPPLKKMKTAHDFQLTAYEFQIKRLEQQLEFAIKDKELTSQQVDGLREQIISMNEKEKKNAIEMEELKFKIVRLEERNVITTKSKDDVNKKLLERTEEKMDLEKKMERIKKWGKKLANELKIERNQNANEIASLNKQLEEKDIKMAELSSLNRQLQENEGKVKELEQSFNTVSSKYQNIKERLTSISKELDGENCMKDSKSTDNIS